MLEIKDLQSVRTSHRQAGVKTKDGFKGMPKDTPYYVYHYLFDKEKSVGVGTAAVFFEGKKWQKSFRPSWPIQVA